MGEWKGKNNMEAFREYYKLFCKTFWKTFWSDIDWRGYSIEFISAIVVGWLYVHYNGWGSVMNNFLDFCLSVLAVPGAIALSYSIYKLIMTPVEIFKVNAEMMRDKDVLANKYTWKDVVISIDEPLSPDENPVVFLNAMNTKPWDIENLQLVVTEITEDWLAIENIKFPLYFGCASDTGQVNWSKVQIDKEGGIASVAIALFLEKKKYAGLLTGDMEEGTENFKEALINIPNNVDVRFRVEWHGTIGKHKLDRFFQDYCINFDGSKIHIKEIKRND